MGNIIFENNLLYRIDGHETLLTSAQYLRTNHSISGLTIRNNTFVSYKWDGIINLGRVLFYSDLFDATCCNNLFISAYEMNGDFWQDSYNNHNIYIKPETEHWLNYHVKITSPSCPLDEYNILGSRDFGILPDYEDVLREWPDAELWNVPGEEESYSYGYKRWDTPLDELFIDFETYNFELKEGARAIGFADPYNAPEVDILGRERDSRPDAGCFEFGATGGDDPDDPLDTDRLVGDVSGDGNITALDASIAGRYAAGLAPSLTSEQIAASDADRNGHVFANDAALIVRYAAGYSDPESHVGETLVITTP
jgi:hypothetical protein